MGKRTFLFLAFVSLLSACGKPALVDPPPAGSEDNSSSGTTPGNGGTTPSPTPAPGTTPTPTPNPNAGMPIDDSKIALDSYGETFSSSIATKLKNSHYMEKNCQNMTSWQEWANLPLEKCSYSSDGQNAQVIMLNAGPRRLTLWLEEACGTFAGNFSSCMTESFNQIIMQSGGQFPVAGVVIEDMDGNGKGNAYVFRNGVTVSVPSIANATESTITTAQVTKSMTDTPTKTYTYARPISVTREQVTAYAKANGIVIPALGTSSERTNVFYGVVGDFYQKAWHSSQNHLIRAWVYAQKF